MSHGRIEPAGRPERGGHQGGAAVFATVNRLKSIEVLSKEPFCSPSARCLFFLPGGLGFSSGRAFVFLPPALIFFRRSTGTVSIDLAARASAANPATSTSSARIVGSSPAAARSAGRSRPRSAAKPFSDWRSILRRWPKAAWVRPCERRQHRTAPASARGINSTTLEVTFGAGVKAAGATSNRIRACVRQPASTPRRP